MLSAHWRQSPLVDALLDYTSQRLLGAIGLHFPASLGAMTWRQSPLPSGSTAGLHFPASLGGGAMRPCDNSTQSDASISDAGQPVCNLYCFPFSWLSGVHVIVEQSLMHTGP